MKNKILNLILIMAFLISLISFSANAALGDIFRAGLTPIEDFFNGGWQNYEKTVTFLVFFFLFFSAFMIGMKKAFGGELTRAHIVFAFVAAFMSSLIIVTTMRFDWVNLEYVAWFLIGVLILFGIYSLLGKLGMEKKKFLAFILALLLMALLLGAVWYLMSEGKPLRGLGRFSDWLGTLGEKAAGLKGEKEGEVKTDLWPGGAPAKGKEVIGGEGKTPWLVGGGGIGLIVIIILLVLMKKKKGKEGKIEEGKKGKPAEDPIKRIIGFLKEVLRRKGIVNKNLKDLEENKEKLLKELPTLMEEVKKAGGIQKFIDNITPYLKNPKYKQNKKIKEEAKGIEKLIISNHTILRLLRILANVETYLVKNTDLVKRHIQQSLGENDKKQIINQLIDNLKKVSFEIISLLKPIFNLSEGEDLIGKRVTKFLSDEYIQGVISRKWIETENKNEEGLRQLVKQEFDIYSKVKRLIKEEEGIIKDIVKILEKAEEEKPQKLFPKAEKEKKSAEGSKLVIIEPKKKDRRVTRGSEIRLKASVKGLNIKEGEYELRWFIRHSLLPPGRESQPMIFSDKYIEEELKKLNHELDEQNKIRMNRDLDDKTRNKAYQEVLKIQRKIYRVKENKAIGNNVIAIIPSSFPLGKALIGAAVYDLNGNVVVKSNSIEIEIIQQ